MSDNENPVTEEESYLDAFKLRLAKNRNIVLEQGEPLAILIEMHGAFLEDYQSLMDRQNEKQNAQIQALIEQSGKVLTKHLMTTFEELKKTKILDEVVTSALSIEKITKELKKAENRILYGKCIYTSLLGLLVVGLIIIGVS